MPGFPALRVIESSKSVSPAEIRLKKNSYSPVAKDLNDEEVFTFRLFTSPRGRKIKRPSSGGKQFKAISSNFSSFEPKKKICQTELKIITYSE